MILTLLFFFVVGSHDLKKLKTTIENMFLEKSKAEKGDKAKKSKGKGKVKLKVEGEHVSRFYEHVFMKCCCYSCSQQKSLNFRNAKLLKAELLLASLNDGGDYFM
jgi:hypothetical protein